MNEFFSKAPLLIGIFQVAVFGMLVGLVGLYFARRERLEKIARRKAAEADAKGVTPENPKAAHA